LANISSTSQSLAPKPFSSSGLPDREITSFKMDCCEISLPSWACP